MKTAFCFYRDRLGKGNCPLPQTPSPKTKPGRLHESLDTPLKAFLNQNFKYLWLYLDGQNERQASHRRVVSGERGVLRQRGERFRYMYSSFVKKPGLRCSGSMEGFCSQFRKRSCEPS